jgi:hypothetical protein
MRKNKMPASTVVAKKAAAKKVRSMARVFKSKGFARDARKAGIKDEELCKAAKELEEGKGEDLGGNVWKKRLNENRSRSIVATKPGSFWLFAYLFSKNDRENIDQDELEAFKKLSKDLGSKGVAGLEKMAIDGSAVEICNDDENNEH